MGGTESWLYLHEVLGCLRGDQQWAGAGPRFCPVIRPSEPLDIWASLYYMTTSVGRVFSDLSLLSNMYYTKILNVVFVARTSNVGYV